MLRGWAKCPWRAFMCGFRGTELRKEGEGEESQHLRPDALLPLHMYRSLFLSLSPPPLSRLLSLPLSLSLSLSLGVRRSPARSAATSLLHRVPLVGPLCSNLVRVGIGQATSVNHVYKGKPPVAFLAKEHLFKISSPDIANGGGIGVDLVLGGVALGVEHRQAPLCLHHSETESCTAR